MTTAPIRTPIIKVKSGDTLPKKTVLDDPTCVLKSLGKLGIVGRVKGEALPVYLLSRK